MEYWIVNNTDPLKLIKEVQRLIKEGWRPQGGVSGYGHILYQALVREANPPKKEE